MADAYAAGLKENAFKGVCGTEEEFDTPEDVERKVGRLAALIRAASTASGGVVVHTGAGISTSLPAGIPDFRGPNGVWTRQQRGEKIEGGIDFNSALPTFTHMAISAMTHAGIVRHVISQNVDGLHLRSGVPRTRLSELHGNFFAERCLSCNAEYIRECSVDVIGIRPTGRSCERPGCAARDTHNATATNQRAEMEPRAEARTRRSARLASSAKEARDGTNSLHSSVLDWGDALPEDDLRGAEIACRRAGLSLCLGTTLQVDPSGRLPLLTTRKRRAPAKHSAGKKRKGDRGAAVSSADVKVEDGYDGGDGDDDKGDDKGGVQRGHIAIVNLQPTPHDGRADVIVRAYVDGVMHKLVHTLGIELGHFVRTETYRVRATMVPDADNNNNNNNSNNNSNDDDDSTPVSHRAHELCEITVDAPNYVRGNQLQRMRFVATPVVGSAISAEVTGPPPFTARVRLAPPFSLRVSVECSCASEDRAAVAENGSSVQVAVNSVPVRMGATFSTTIDRVPFCRWIDAEVERYAYGWDDVSGKAIASRVECGEQGRVLREYDAEWRQCADKACKRWVRGTSGGIMREGGDGSHAPLCIEHTQESLP